MTNPLENIYEKLTHMHKMVIIWWYWHICKGEVVGVETDQVGEEKEKKSASFGCSGVRSCIMTRILSLSCEVNGKIQYTDKKGFSCQFIYHQENVSTDREIENHELVSLLIIYFILLFNSYSTSQTSCISHARLK